MAEARDFYRQQRGRGMRPFLTAIDGEMVIATIGMKNKKKPRSI